MLSRLTLAGERMNRFELSSHDCSSKFSSTPPCSASVDPSVAVRSMANLGSGENRRFVQEYTPRTESFLAIPVPTQ